MGKLAAEYLVHVKVLDEQHQRLFDIIEELRDANATGKAREVAAKLLGDLCDYAHVHFKEEEDLMKKAGYAALSAHRVAHRDFIDRIEKMMADLGRGHGATLGMDLSAFLTEWLQKHVRIADQQYVEILHSRGIK